MPQASLPFADIAVEDWDDLLRAVTARLRQVASATLPHELDGATVQLQTSVLECVDALEQLHASLRRSGLPSNVSPRPDGDAAAPRLFKGGVSARAVAELP